MPSSTMPQRARRSTCKGPSAWDSESRASNRADAGPVDLGAPPRLRLDRHLLPSTLSLVVLWSRWPRREIATTTMNKLSRAVFQRSNRAHRAWY